MAAETLVINERLQIPLAEFEFSFARSSGPGGQNVNKVNSKATLRWHCIASTSLPADVRDRFRNRYGTRLTGDGDLIVVSQRFREQGRNVDDCLEKLREMILAVAVPPRRRRATRPTRGSKERRLETKRTRSATKQSRGKKTWET